MPTAEVFCLEPSANTISLPTTTSESKATVGVNTIPELSAESIVVPTKVIEPVLVVEFIVMVSVPAFVVIVIFEPATSVNVSAVESAITLDWPATVMLLNVFGRLLSAATGTQAPA
jgi:hypothetical protein